LDAGTGIQIKKLQGPPKGHGTVLGTTYSSKDGIAPLDFWSYTIFGIARKLIQLSWWQISMPMCLASLICSAKRTS